MYALIENSIAIVFNYNRTESMISSQRACNIAIRSLIFIVYVLSKKTRKLPSRRYHLICFVIKFETSSAPIRKKNVQYAHFVPFGQRSTTTVNHRKNYYLALS